MGDFIKRIYKVTFQSKDTIYYRAQSIYDVCVHLFEKKFCAMGDVYAIQEIKRTNVGEQIYDI